MGESPSCEEVEALLFERRREELTELSRAMVDRHLKKCAPCRQMATKMGELFDTAADDDPSLWADIDADALFDSIEDAIAEDGDDVDRFDEEERLDELFESAGDYDPVEAGDVDAEATFAGIAQRVCDDKESKNSLPSRGRRVGVIAAAAVAACVALAGWWLLSSDDGAIFSDDIEEPPVEVAEADTSKPIVERDSVLAVPLLHAVSTPRESLRLFVDDGAEYEFVVADADDAIELSDGILLAERRPGAETGLSVRVQSHTVTVTGTVFSVETGDDVPRVAVYEGSVDITEPDGEKRRLVAGEYTEAGQKGTIDGADYSQIDAYVDLEEHRRLLRQVKEKTGDRASFRVFAAVDVAQKRAETTSAAFAPTDDGRQRDKLAPTVSEEEAVEESVGKSEGDDLATEEAAPSTPEEEIVDEDVGKSESDDVETEEAADAPSLPSPEELHEEALAALHEERPQKAANLLVEALELVDPSERARADILLELAGVKLRQLDNPQMAAHYLEKFVEQWPDDPAADAIRNQLCELGIDKGDC